MAKFKIGDLTRVEWELMNICWEKGVCSAKDVHLESLKNKKRDYNTIRTILDKLVEKNVLSRSKFGPIWLYKAIMTEKKATSTALNDFMQLVLGNKTAPVFKYFIKENKYDIDIDELKQLIDKLENE